MCVIFCKIINGKYIFFKNRDRPFISPIKIVQEIKNGIELAYMKDLKSGWVEGMNEYGIGIINTTFKHKSNKLNLEHILKNNKYDSVKGQKIHNALLCKTVDEVVNYLFTQKSNETFLLYGKNVDGNEYPVEGHTFVFSREAGYHVECTKENKYIINKVFDNEVYTNHGIHFPKEGMYGLASVLRKYICEYELINNEIPDPENLFSIMNKNYYNLNPSFHLYRGRFFNMHSFNNFQTVFKIFKPVLTVSQLLINPSENEIVINIDKNNGKLVQVENRLPSNYVSKINIKINETAKSEKKVKLLLDDRILQSFYKKFSYNEISLKQYKIQIFIILLLILLIIVYVLFFTKKSNMRKLLKRIFHKN